MLRESGLLYGTPQQQHEAPTGAGPEEALFLAVLRQLCRLALDVAVLTGAPRGPREGQLLVLFAALNGQLDLALSLHGKQSRSVEVPQKLLREVEEALSRRAVSLAADLSYGLVLHNGALYADARLFGRLAISYFAQRGFAREALERRLLYSAKEKARLVEVLVGLACAGQKPGYPTRRAILRQIEDLALPEPLAGATADFARRAFDRPPSMKRLTQGLKSLGLKRFILEQTVLASLVDGSRSPHEVQWTKELAAALGFTPAALRTTELQMAEFYARHRGVVDVFRVGGGAAVLGEEWVDEFQVTLKRHYRALLKEVRETQELSVLLARAARGQKLTAAQKKAMREQLVDVAKAVPALAIFAAPGGVLLLMALAKVLPFDLRPSAFHDDESGEG